MHRRMEEWKSDMEQRENRWVTDWYGSRVDRSMEQEHEDYMIVT